MEKLLITGASGFLGYNLVNDLKSGYAVTATVHHERRMPSDVHVIPVDLPGKVDAVDHALAGGGYCGVVHAAALADADFCERNPDAARRVNVDGSVELARLSRRHDIPLIFISTDLVYGRGAGPHVEGDADPTLVYSRSKVEAEQGIADANPLSVSLRCALIYGPDNGVNSSFVRRMDRNIREGGTLNLFTDQIRSPVWTGDISGVIREVLRGRISPGVYNLGGPDHLTRYAFGRFAGRLLGWDENRIRPVRMADLPNLAGRPGDCSLSCDRLLREVTWKRTTVREGLAALKGSWSR